MTPTLDQALIGNCSISALVNSQTEIVWGCLPRFDSDAVFCSLLRKRRNPDDCGFFGIDIADFDHAEQHYLENTAILVTPLFDN